MKTITLFIGLFSVAILQPCDAQVSAQKQESAARQVRESRYDVELPVLSTLARGVVDRTDSIVFSAWSGSLVFEGATADAHETTLSITDPTADRTITLPNASGTAQLSQASTAVSLTTDDQAVTPGAFSVIQLSSNNATAAQRTFTLSATGAITGQIYILIAPADNGCEIADTGIQKLSAAWSPGATDTLTLLFDGTNFLEIARANN